MLNPFEFAAPLLPGALSGISSGLLAFFAATSGAKSSTVVGLLISCCMCMIVGWLSFELYYPHVYATSDGERI